MLFWIFRRPSQSQVALLCDGYDYCHNVSPYLRTISVGVPHVLYENTHRRVSHCGSCNGAKVRLMDLCLLDEDDKLKASFEAYFSYLSYINNRLLDFHLYRTTCALTQSTSEESLYLGRPTVVSLAISVQTGICIHGRIPSRHWHSRRAEFYSLLQLLLLPKVVHQDLGFLHYVLD